MQCKLLDFTWSFTSARRHITPETLPSAMGMRAPSAKREPCVQTYNGPIVLPNGIVMACSCVAAMDAIDDLGIGNILERPLGEIWRSERMHRLRASFGTASLNTTHDSCDMYRNLELYRTEGRARARVSRARSAGVKRRSRESDVFRGG